MTTLNDEIAALTRALIADRRSPSTAGRTTFDTRLWQSLEETELTGPELLDAADGDPVPAIAVLDELAAAAADLPMLEHLWLGNWLLSAAELTAPGVLIPIADAGLALERSGSELLINGEAHGVTWGGAAQTFLILFADGTLAAVPAAEAAVHTTGDAIGAPTSSVRFSAVRLGDGQSGLSRLSPEAYRDRRTVGRLIEIRGAARAAIEHSIAYVGQRVQFGRPLAKFQAVQSRIAGAMGEYSMLNAGVNLALAGSPLDIMLARIDARRSVTDIHRSTHQVHGAMGVTAEHPLGFVTARMITWLADTGTDTEFGGRARECIRADGAWEAIVAPMRGTAPTTAKGDSP